MNNNQITRHNKILNFSGIVIVSACLVYFATGYQMQKNDIISKEEVECVSAICILEPSGDRCFEFNPSLTKVLRTADLRNKQANRILIEPSAKQCGFSPNKVISNGSAN